MTYCVAASLNEGMLFISDTRTNAGVDQVSTYNKMTILKNKGERVLIILAAGNLATTQAVINLLKNPENETSVMTPESLFDVVEIIGNNLKQVVLKASETGLNQSGTDFSASFLVGGQIRGERSRLFLVYPQGNFIEATKDTPFLQIGESKYGKPILDRIIKPETPMSEAVKCGLVSIDSTIMSNLSVGLPIDLAIVQPDTYTTAFLKRIDQKDEYFDKLRDEWSEGLSKLFAQLPLPDWYQAGTLPATSPAKTLSK